MPAYSNYPTTYVNANGITVPMPNGSRPIQYGVQTNNLIQTMESGHEQRRKKGDPRQTFEYSYIALTQEAAVTLRNFFMQMGGSTQAFYWTDFVSKITYLVRFNMEGFAMENFAHNSAGPLYKIPSIKLIQVF